MSVASDLRFGLPEVRGIGHIATSFIASYARGDASGMLTLCATGATAEYVPWGAGGRNPIAEAVEVWARYPAAFEAFSMPITGLFEDPQRRVAIVTTLNGGVQRSDVDGIACAGGEMRCPHLFVLSFNESSRITRVQVWCDQVTLYRQLGFPMGFVAERAL